MGWVIATALHVPVGAVGLHPVGVDVDVAGVEVDPEAPQATVEGTRRLAESPSAPARKRRPKHSATENRASAIIFFKSTSVLRVDGLDFG